jgi:hypothetical protein
LEVSLVPNERRTFFGAALGSLLAAATLAAGSAAASPTGPSGGELVVPRADLHRSLEAAELRVDYDRLYARAERLGAAPKRALTAGPHSPSRLGQAIKRLRERVRRAQRRAGQPRGSGTGTPESVGVASATLEAIAACESGGNPSAVSAGGTYRGKYQFSYSTWAAVGGSGDPAAASVAEQDYRAALLYSRSGSSPWPICG